MRSVIDILPDISCVSLVVISIEDGLFSVYPEMILKSDVTADEVNLH